MHEGGLSVGCGPDRWRQTEGAQDQRGGTAEEKTPLGVPAPHSSSLLMASSPSALSGPAVPDMGSAVDRAPSSPLTAGPAHTAAEGGSRGRWAGVAAGMA